MSQRSFTTLAPASVFWDSGSMIGDAASPCWDAPSEAAESAGLSATGITVSGPAGEAAGALAVVAVESLVAPSAGDVADCGCAISVAAARSESQLLASSK